MIDKFSGGETDRLSGYRSYFLSPFRRILFDPLFNCLKGGLGLNPVYFIFTFQGKVFKRRIIKSFRLFVNGVPKERVFGFLVSEIVAVRANERSEEHTSELQS